MPWFEDEDGNGYTRPVPRFFEDDIMNAEDPLRPVTWGTRESITLEKNTERDQSMKKDAGKPRMELIDWGFVEETARVLGFGAAKYEANGWRKGMQVTRVIGSMFRHMIAFAMGQDKDPESGLSHLGHVGCNLMFLVAYLRDKPELDDRVKVIT